MEQVSADSQTTILLEEGQYRQVLSLLKAALDYDSTNPNLWYRYAYALHKCGKWWQAIQAVSIAIRLANTHPDYYALLARLLLYQGRHEQALYTLDCGLALNNAHAECLWQKAEVLCRQFNLAEAERIIDRIELYESKRVLTTSELPIACYRSIAELEPLMKTVFETNPFVNKTDEAALDTLLMPIWVLKLKRFIGDVPLGLLGLYMLYVAVRLLLFLIDSERTNVDLLPLFILYWFVVAFISRRYLYFVLCLIVGYKRQFINTYSRVLGVCVLTTLVLACLTCFIWYKTASLWLFALNAALVGFVLVFHLGKLEIVYNPNAITQPGKRWWAKTGLPT
jgi:tetratricopeptide (TPR) repeat protein